MILFRSINNLALSFFGPLFYAIPLIIYGILKLKTRKDTLPDGVASFEKRAFALVFDVGLLYAIEIGLLQYVTQFKNSPNLPINFIVVMVSFLNMIVLPSVTGWSLGKRLFGIKIVKKQNQAPGFFDIFYREIVKSWFSIPLLFLGCFWMLIGKAKLTWHDNVADTRVLSIAYSEEQNMLTDEFDGLADKPFKL